jgi:hypothetical protein
MWCDGMTPEQPQRARSRELRVIVLKDRGLMKEREVTQLVQRLAHLMPHEEFREDYKRLAPRIDNE